MRIFLYVPASRSHSMIWTMRIGDRVLVEDVDPARLRRGDLVVFWLGEQRGLDARWAVHRLLTKRRIAGRWELRTRGDSCSKADAPFGPERLAGKAIKIKRDGRWLDADAGWGARRHRLVGAAARAYFLAHAWTPLGLLRDALRLVYRSRRAAWAPPAWKRALLGWSLWIEEALLPG